MKVCCVLFLGLTTACCIAAAEETPPVGFLAHFHAGELDKMAAAPVTAELADLIHWRVVEPLPENPTLDDIHVDFSSAAAWLPMLRETGRKGYPIIDTAMHHSSIPWRHKMTGAVGENAVDATGNVMPFSSLHSPLFRQSILNYIEAFTKWFRENDQEGLVPGYLDGAEWFYPGFLDYSPMAISAFHAWLESRYSAPEALAEAWGEPIRAWEEADPPRFLNVGGFSVNEPTFTLEGGIDASYAGQRFPVTPGAVYLAEADVEGDSLAARLAGIHIAWYNAAGTHFSVTPIAGEERAPGRYRISGEVIAPDSAVAAVLHLKLLAPGKAVFRSPAMSLAGSDTSLFSADAKDWTHLQYVGTSAGTASGVGEALALTMEAPMPEAASGRAPALDDWVTFSYEAMADWLETCARKIKECDPSRRVLSYVGFVFAQQAQWDYAMANQRLDISLANTPSIDVNGIQLCIAADDFTWATHVIDTARKYEKPIWATDLIDFPYGLYSGFETHYRGAMAAVQHGLSGAFFCHWKGIDDYSFLHRLTTTDRNRLLNDTRTAIEALEGFQVVTNAALLMPIMPYSMENPGGDMIDSGGFYHLLQDGGITVDVWTPYELERAGADALEDYAVVFMSDCPELSRTVHERLCGFVADGGRIIGSGRLPSTDRLGRPLAPNFDGPASVRTLGNAAGRRYWGKLRRAKEYGNTPPVLVEAPDPERTPAMRRELRERLFGVIDELGVALPLRVVNATGDAHVTLLHQPETDAWKAFLVHKAPGRCHHVDLKFSVPGAISGIEAWRDFDTRLPGQDRGEGIWRTPDFAHACLLSLTLEQGRAE